MQHPHRRATTSPTTSNNLTEVATTSPARNNLTNNLNNLTNNLNNLTEVELWADGQQPHRG